MASSFKLRRFSNPSILKSIARPLLLKFLQPHEAFFSGRGFALTDTDAFDYDELASILMSPAEDTPEGLMDALFFVDEMSVHTLFDDLVHEAEAADVDLGPTDETTAADVTIRVWLADPDVLQQLHAERFLTKAKSFQSFLSVSSDLPKVRKPSAAKLRALEEDLNDWFETKKRGRGTRVFAYFRDGFIWFLVRHGEPYKREGTLQNGAPSSIFFRPEKFDVLNYNHELGELAIHAGTKGEKKAYCELFGKHIFGSREFFDVEGRGGKYTLAPIREVGRACLVCTDVAGIEYVQLAELHIRHDSHQYHVEKQTATDVFQALEDIGRSIPESGALVKASFRVKFKNAVRPRTVVIRPPHVAIFDRESDSDLLNEWMTKRGFIRVTRAAIDDQPDTALEVA